MLQRIQQVREAFGFAISTRIFLYSVLTGTVAGVRKPSVAAVTAARTRRFAQRLARLAPGARFLGYLEYSDLLRLYGEETALHDRAE
jgi:hypothetical protein